MGVGFASDIGVRGGSNGDGTETTIGHSVYGPGVEITGRRQFVGRARRVQLGTRKAGETRRWASSQSDGRRRLWRAFRAQPARTRESAS